MKPDEYTNSEQISASERTVNTDPREQQQAYNSAYSPQRPQRRKRAPWLILLLCVLILIIVAGLAVLTGGIPIFARRKTLPTQTFTFSGRSTLVVNEDNGSLRVHAGSTDQMIVQPTEYADGLGTDLNGLQVRYAQQGNTLTVTTSEDGGRVFGSRGIDLDITVPSSVDVSVHNASGDVSLTGINGQIGANVDSGNLSLNSVNGSLNLSASSGNITITNAYGPVSANASSGNIQFSGTLDPRGTYLMEASSGNITMSLPASSSFQLTASADSGSVHNDFSAAEVGSAPRATIKLSANSGDIRVQKQ